MLKRFYISFLSFSPLVLGTLQGERRATTCNFEAVFLSFSSLFLPSVSPPPWEPLFSDIMGSWGARGSSQRVLWSILGLSGGSRGALGSSRGVLWDPQGSHFGALWLSFSSLWAPSVSRPPLGTLFSGFDGFTYTKPSILKPVLSWNGKRGKQPEQETLQAE